MSASFATRGLLLTEHEFSVPLDHSRPDGERITVFAREVADPDGRDRPLLVFLQGGPGSEAPRPTRYPSAPGLAGPRAARLPRAHARPARHRALEPDRRAARADRRASRPSAWPTSAPTRSSATPSTSAASWARARGACSARASAGCASTTYLSIAPEGLREAFVTGGLPPLGPRIDDVYRATYARTLERSRRYYERYPDDRERVRALRRAPARPRTSACPSRRPARPPRRLRQLGGMLGMSDGAEEPALPARAARRLARLPPRRRGGARLRAQPALRRAPRGVLGRRRRDALVGASACCPPPTTTRPSSSPASTSIRGCSRTTARWRRCARPRTSSPRTSGRACTTPTAWRANEVPVAAAIYAEDMYVERAFSEETAAAIRGLRPWLTNEYEHNGLRADGARILGHLIDLARGRA